MPVDYSVKLEVLPGRSNDFFCDGPVKVTFEAQPGYYMEYDRFTCSICSEAYYPVCCSSNPASETRRSKGRLLEMDIPCSRVWLPGNYMLLITDELDDSTVRVDFTLDDHLKCSAGLPQLCNPSGNDAIAAFLQTYKEWNVVAGMPGTAQMRLKMIQDRQLFFYNAMRKAESLGTIRVCRNLLVCTRNGDISNEVLTNFLTMLSGGYQLACVDCSTLIDASRRTPSEDLEECLDDLQMKVLCLTRLNELTGTVGKTVIRKIVDRLALLQDETLFWLFGSQQEIDSLIGTYPSLHQFFRSDSYVKQEPYTALELVQAFFDMLTKENLKADDAVKDRLTRAILQGYDQGALVDWSLHDVAMFVSEDICRQYVNRTLMMFDHISPNITEEDINFPKLTNRFLSFDESIRELNAMVGLEKVKEGILTLSNAARLYHERRRRGLKTSGMVYHAIFTGNPGTGKTTVARQLGRIYHSLGLLSRGEVITVDRMRLVGRFLGETEDNMKNVLEQAKGNVLFIDEAYTLYTGGDDRMDYGARVLESLLTVLTQPDPDMLIVFAGYKMQMDAMFSANPGLSGRFPYRYHFEDYTKEQLLEIACRLLSNEEYILTDEAAAVLEDAISQTFCQHLSNFSNARWIDQFVHHGIIPAMADRVFSLGSNDFQHIEASDVLKAFEKFNPKVIALESRHHIAGFGA